MANPQIENGYTKIANDIMDALVRTRIPGEARLVLDAILRKTYGWGKTKDIISLSQFVKMTGLSKGHVCRGINKLLEMNIITKKGNAKSYFTKKGNEFNVTYSLQKDYEKWNTLPKKVTLSKKAKDVTQKGNLTLPKKGHTKETITKETKEKKLYKEIFQHWNSLKIIVHKKLSSKMEKAIRSALKDYSQDEIKKYMKNFIDTIESKDCYWTKRYTLIEFLSRGIDRFTDEANPLENMKNFKKGGKNGIGKNKQSARKGYGEGVKY